MKYKIPFLIIMLSVVSLILETTTINFPFTFLTATIVLLFSKKTLVYIGAFLLGFVIDALRVTNFGMTPLFIFATVFLIVLYEKYSGSKDLLVASFIIGALVIAYVYFLSYSLFLLSIFFIVISSLAITFYFMKKKGLVFG